MFRFLARYMERTDDEASSSQIALIRAVAE
jgi:hypothetical protein